MKNVIKEKYETIHKEYINSDSKSLKDFCRIEKLSYVVISRNFSKYNLQLFKYKPNRKYDKELYLKIYEEHLKDYVSIKNLCSKYNISNCTLRKNLRAMGLDIIEGIIDSNTKDHRFLDSIDTPLKAYYLGWLYSDGCITNDIQLSMAKEDSYLMDKFKEVFGGNIYYYDKRKDHYKDMASYRIASKHAIASLNALGCVSRKSTEGMTFPPIDKVLERYFILGFFDGDGSIYKSGRSIRIKFISTSKKFLSKIEEILTSWGCTDMYYWTSNSNIPCHQLIIGNEQSRQIIKSYFYRNNDTYLIRKYNKFCKLVTPSKLLEVTNKKLCND